MLILIDLFNLQDYIGYNQLLTPVQGQLLTKEEHGEQELLGVASCWIVIDCKYVMGVASCWVVICYKDCNKRIYCSFG